MTDFSVAVRIIGNDASTEYADLNDTANGLAVETLQQPDDAVRAVVVDSEYVDGDYAVAEADAAGTLVVVLTVEGSTWGQVETRWQAVRTAYRTDANFYIETAVEGVTKRWATRRPDVSPGGTDASNLMGKAQTFVLRFPVQPNPTVTVA